MKITVTIFVFSLFALCACSKKREISIIKINVNNQSKTDIDSVVISTYNFKIKYDMVKSSYQMLREAPWIYKGKYEGAFHYSIHHENAIVAEGTFGYFSSGSDVQDLYYFNIRENFKIDEKAP